MSDIIDKFIPEVVENTAENILDKPSKEIGTTLSDIWYLVFGKFSFMADKKRLRYAHDLEQFKKELEAAADAIPEENRIEPSIQITAQALESSKYCVSSETLRHMFVNLISGSMNKNFEHSVHPSFPEILKQLNENDAHFLAFLKSDTTLPVADIGYKTTSGYQLLSRYILLPHGNLSSDECTLSGAALERAGLISLSTGNEYLTDEAAYDPYKELPVYKQAEAIASQLNTNVHFSKGTCRLTNLGKAFINVCV